jgi:hypothetical protein
MKRGHVIVSGSLALAIGAAGGAVVWIPSGPGPVRRAATSGFQGDVGVAGPFGLDAFSLVPAYFKRVRFSGSQLGQFQDIDAHLPAGKYLVKIRTRSSAGGEGPDCMGVSFPLAQSVAGGKAFRGYVSVPHDGDATTVSCYEQPASTTTSTATYDLFYIPIVPKSAAS